MVFKKHSNLDGGHAFLGASKYHWVNYDIEKLAETYRNYAAAERGSKLHEFAKSCIELGVKLPKTKETLNMYVNDAIGYKMTPEQVLVYSDNCFGTADAISFRNNFLRIHDFKSGVTPASIIQLEIYASLFCLEYRQKPEDIQIELRIYQSKEIIVNEPESGRVNYIMDKIILFDKEIERLKKEEGLP